MVGLGVLETWVGFRMVKEEAEGVEKSPSSAGLGSALLHPWGQWGWGEC